MCPRHWCSIIGIAALAAAASAGTRVSATPQFASRDIVPETRTGFLLLKAAYYGVAPADFDGDGRADLSSSSRRHLADRLRGERLRAVGPDRPSTRAAPARSRCPRTTTATAAPTWR